MKYVPVLTLSRMVLAPVFTMLLTTGSNCYQLAAIAVLVVCLSLEIADGWRIKHSGYGAGYLLIAFVDGVARFAVFAAFLSLGYARLWMLVILFYRDAALAWARIATASHHQVFTTRWSGKIAAWCEGTVSLAVAILIILADRHGLNQYSAGIWLLTASTAVTACCGLDYLVYSLRLGLAESNKQVKSV